MVNGPESVADAGNLITSAASHVRSSFRHQTRVPLFIACLSIAETARAAACALLSGAISKDHRFVVVAEVADQLLPWQCRLPCNAP